MQEAAARQLLARPRVDYRPVLLAGLRYPWLPVAQHARETLVFVKDVEAVPQLKKLLAYPDPTAVLRSERDGSAGGSWSSSPSSI